MYKRQLYLSDNCNFPTKWRIPSEANLVVQPKSTVVIWCAGYFRGYQDCGTPERPARCPRPIPPYMAPFRLSAAGEWIGLYEADGKTLIDGFEIPPLPLNKTFGCYPDGDKNSRGYLEEPTIGQITDDRASGAPNAKIVNLGPIIDVRSYRGVKDKEKGIYSKIVEPGQEIRILVEVRDYDDPQPDDLDNNLEEVILHWRKAGSSNERVVSMTPVEDPSSGKLPKLFEAFIPGQENGTLLEFWITATDKQGASSDGYANPATQLPFLILVGSRGDFSATLSINEILASNAPCPDYREGEQQDPSRPHCTVGGADERMEGTRVRKEADDWIEIYNFGDEPISLENIYLTDSMLEPINFPLSLAAGLTFDCIENGSLRPKSHLLIWCDGETDRNEDISGIHAPFLLNAQEDAVYLIAYQDSDDDTIPEIFMILDYLSWGPREGREKGPQFGPQEADWSVGRYPDGTGSWGRMVPTAGVGISLPDERIAYAGGPNGPLVPSLRLLGFEPIIPELGKPLKVFVRAWDEKPLPEGSVQMTYYGGENNLPEKTVTFVKDPGPDFDIYRYSAVLDDPDLMGVVYYKIKVTDSDGNTTRIPAHSETIWLSLYFGEREKDDLIITEVMAANRNCPCEGEKPEGCEKGGLDPYGDADDWVCLLYTSPSPRD